MSLTVRLALVFSFGRHGHGLWPSWFVAVMVDAIMVEAVMVYGGHGVGPNCVQNIICVIFVCLFVAELYLNSCKFDAAYACIQEASSYNPISHSVSYMV